MNNAELLDVLRELARNETRFITLADLCAALQLDEVECTDLLERFLEQGLLRATEASNGQPYFWLTPQLSE